MTSTPSKPPLRAIVIGLLALVAVPALAACGGTDRGSSNGTDALGQPAAGGQNGSAGLGAVAGSAAGQPDAGPLQLSDASAGSGGQGAAGAAGTGEAGAGTGAAGTGQAGSGAAGMGGNVGSTFHFVAYGDTRTNYDTHQRIVDGFAKLNPELVVHSGDLWDGYTPDMFRAILTKNANIAALLNSQRFIVARGNHETVADYTAFTPSVSHGTGMERYSFAQGNSFFVVLGMDPAGSETFLEQQLMKPEAQSAKWRFVFSHYPIYSGGQHGASGAASLEWLCDQYQVAIYFCGHDHIYERTYQMKAQAIADNGDQLQLTKGTVYVVSGGGGAPLYVSSKQAWTHTNESVNNYVDVVATDLSLTVNAYRIDGSKLDAFVISQ